MTAGSRRYGICHLDPQGPDAPVPAGIPAEGPRPGQVFLSPELERLDPDIGERYGERAGTTSESGLADPGGLLVCIIADLDPETADERLVEGEGGPWETWSPHLFLREADSVPFAILAIIAGMIVFPAGALALAASRLGGEARDGLRCRDLRRS